MGFIMAKIGNAKRFIASGAIGDAGKSVIIAGIEVMGLASDSTVTIYDSTGAGPAGEEKWQCSLQPGGNKSFTPWFRLSNGGYVQIDGTAKVFLYLV